VDRDQLADFLSNRRRALQPEDVGLPRGMRRRTEGLRREEVAALAGMSTDYVSRLEQRRGPQPSQQMLSSIARALHLSLDERDHLFRLAGHNVPERTLRANHVNPGLMRIIDRLTDTPAQIMGGLGETLIQTPLARALLGDETRFTGLARSAAYRWFSDPDARTVYPPEEHDTFSRVVVSDLRTATTREGPASAAAELVQRLLAESPEFAELWAAHLVGVGHDRRKRIKHPELGILELDCQRVFDADQGQILLVFTATPGSDSAEKLRLLSVIGEQRMTL
jgi:transcriptional regulator with XRE-family HTH domain